MSHSTGEIPVAEALDVAPDEVENAVEAATEDATSAGLEDDSEPTLVDNTIRNAAIGGVIGVFLIAGAIVATALGLPVPWAGSGPDYGAAREIPISDASDDELEQEWVPAYLLPRSTDGGDAADQPDVTVGITRASTTTTPSPDTGSAPVANDDTITIRANTTVNLYVLDNDRDEDQDLAGATVSIVSGPSHALRFSVEDDHFRYRPHRDRGEQFVPQDGFVYQVCDSTGLCDTATVTILVVSR